MIAVWIGVGVLVALVSYVIVAYNRFVAQRQLITDSWRDIDVELQRRHDLIPNLVSTVKGYAAHEQAVFEAVAAARTEAIQAAGASPADREPAETEVTQRLGRLFAVAEAYPDLKADAGFLDLQAQLVETEDRIAAARRFYNLNVGSYNTRVATVPSNLVAGWFDFEPSPFFEITDAAMRTAPGVQM